jgi:hypothetical protein
MKKGLLMTSVCNLADGFTFFLREDPERPGVIQCGYLADITPVELGMTFQASPRLIRIAVPGLAPIYIPNPPKSIYDAINAGAEFWVGSIAEDGDAYLALPG